MGYEKDFEIQMLKSYGNSFQDLFYRLMKELYSDFMPIKAHGPLGDHGCDGYLSGSGTYFQVYGPENPPSNQTLSYAQNKMKEDFNKLWNFIASDSNFTPISKYVFLFNNKLDATVSMGNSQQFEELRKIFNDITFEIWDTQCLMGLFRTMSAQKQANVLLIHQQLHTNQDLLKNIHAENTIADINTIRSIKTNAQNLMNIVNSEDFVAPFHIVAIEYTDNFILRLSNILFNSEALEQMKYNMLSSVSNLLMLIQNYTKPCSTTMGVMKRIEPWGEIKDEDFEDVRDKMNQARKNTYSSIELLLAQELLLIDQIK